jgi:hypothetical protein
MSAISVQCGRWEVECLPDDGARLRSLRFAGHDLLTQPPRRFHPPAQDLGQYETRPVYGYDDCFPSIDACDLPGQPSVRIRDHGELCWLSWEVSPTENGLMCRTRSAALPALQFQRTLIFADAALTWQFEVANDGAVPVPFLHVMHALMPLENVVGLRLPRFNTALDETTDRQVPFSTPNECATHLLALPRGQVTMLLLRGVRNGRFQVAFANDLTLTVDYPAELFPTLGVWWNNAGYPDEDPCRRTECALEPIPGTWSSLARSWTDGAYLSAAPGRRCAWRIVWRIETLGRLHLVGQ